SARDRAAHCRDRNGQQRRRRAARARRRRVRVPLRILPTQATLSEARMTQAAVTAQDEQQTAAEPYTLVDLLRYFLHLGTFGFGGPIALCGYMQRDLVERRRWVAPEDYKQGLALAQLAPGPLAAQLAIYLGWIRGGVLGATAVAFAFILPSFVMVIALSVV